MIIDEKHAQESNIMKRRDFLKFACATGALAAFRPAFSRAARQSLRERYSEYLDPIVSKWRTEEDIVDAWDWSLPPDVSPAERSAVKTWGQMPGGFRGNSLGGLNWNWRKIEPEEGRYDFESMKKAIRRAARGHHGLELHVRASVWTLRGFPNEGEYPPNWIERNKTRNASAPRWLEKYDIPLVEERPKMNLSTPFQIVNMDLYHPDYHTRYLRMVEALGQSGIPEMDEIMFVMVHFKSGTRGEEAGGAWPIERDSREGRVLDERLRAWSRAFDNVHHKLCWVGHAGWPLDLAYELGMGQRNGFVEMYMMHADNPQLGQRLEDGYLVTDESLPPIAENRAFGDENEEYSPNAHVPRFGPISTWPHRYRESMLRALQMRRNFLWAEGNPWVNPALLSYVGLELGRNVRDAPDAWCYLRESYIGPDRKPPRPVKNFERWLHQRDREGFETEPAVKVDVPDTQRAHHRDRKYDYIARRGNRIGFTLDKRFLSGGPHRVAVKITYHDTGTGRWSLVYGGSDGEKKRAVACHDTGKIRTATFFLEDAHFPDRGNDYDLRIVAEEGKATVSFVRVVKIKRR